MRKFFVSVLAALCGGLVSSLSFVGAMHLLRLPISALDAAVQAFLLLELTFVIGLWYWLFLGVHLLLTIWDTHWRSALLNGVIAVAPAIFLSVFIMLGTDDGLNGFWWNVLSICVFLFPGGVITHAIHARYAEPDEVEQTFWNP